MTPSRLLRLAKTELATPESAKEGTHCIWICDALEVASRDAGDAGAALREVDHRVAAEIATLAPCGQFRFYPSALAHSIGIEGSNDAWKQRVRHTFVERLIVEYEAAGR